MATWYINADTGNDTTGDGSSGNPWLTISKAHTEASADDTVVCQDSTATFTWTTQVFTKNLTVQGEQDDASGAVFDGAAASFRWDIGANTITIEKITFQNAASVATERGTFTLVPNTVLVMTACIFDGIITPTSGVDAGLIGTLSGEIDITSVTITNCLFNDCVGNNVGGTMFHQRAGPATTAWVITGCTIYQKNTVNQHSRILGLINANISVTTTVKNCIFANATGNTVDWNHASSSAVETHTNNCDFNITGPPAGTGNITSDPLLVDPDNDNFNIRPASPCIDSGVLI